MIASWLLIVLAGLGPTGLQVPLGNTPPPSRTESVALFANDVIGALRQAGSAADVIRNVKVTDESVTTLLATMTARRQAISRLQQGRALLASHLSSQNESVKDAASAFDLVFAALQEQWRLGISLDERLLKAETVEAIKAVVPDASKVAASIDEAWRMLPLAIGMLTGALIDDTRLVDGKIAYLRLTAVERARLIAITKTAFPKSLIAGDKQAVDSSVYILRTWLTGRWKTADEGR